MAGPELVEIRDVQGIVLRGYGALKSSCFLALRIGSVPGARAWLSDIAGEVTSAADPVADRNLNVAFTYGALERLGLPPGTLAGFRSAFVEGMVGRAPLPSHRNLALGDVGLSAPDRWRWGNEKRPIDVALLLFARDDAGIRELTVHHRERLKNHGLAVVEACETYELPQRKEHFGFRDGISQPAVLNANPREERPGVLEAGRPENTVAPGELLLGYRNHYGALAGGRDARPARPANGGSPSHPIWRDGQLHGFARNGSFLVWRQLEQDVPEFWSAIRDGSDDDPAARRQLAAKLFGRWPSGAPLSLAPEFDDSALADRNDFLYAEEDPHGYHTPLGSHIRRGNPRDWHLSTKPKRALGMANGHRIIRRGRPYGPPVASSMSPEDIIAAGFDSHERGLQFLGFVADIERQFEVIQGAWLNDPKFGDLEDDRDPVLGETATGKGSFTVQATPIRRCISGLSRFVKVRGGAYLFMPGLSAVRFLGAMGGGGADRTQSLPRYIEPPRRGGKTSEPDQGADG